MFSAILLWSARISLGLLTLVSLLPLLPSGQWWVRVWEFPRVQLAVLLLVPLALVGIHLWRTGRRVEHAILAGIAVAVAAWQVWNIAPFTTLWPTEVPLAQETDARAFRMLTLNLDYESKQHEAMLQTIRQQDADLVLLLEVDEKWDKALRPLDQEYRDRIGVVRGEGLGIVLWSRFPLVDKQVRHLVSRRRPSIFATVQLPGDRPLRYVGLHPTPPALKDRIEHNDLTDERRDSRVRDAELVLVAREVRKDPDQRWLVTGDFNDVAWSRTTRLFKDLSDLKDPRVGRWLMNTYHAQKPLWRYPIDHVFVSDGLHLASMERVRAPGSDHFAVAATFTRAEKDEGVPNASAEEKQEAEEMLQEGAADAAEHDVADE